MFRKSHTFGFGGKRNRITLDQAYLAIEAFDQIPIRLCDINLNKSIELAESLVIDAYDAYFIECAKTYKSPLLALDKGLVDCAIKSGIKTIEV